jgi:lysophospholipase L1-like esterase
MLETQEQLETPAQTPAAAVHPERPSRTRFVLLLLAVAAILFSRVYIPNIHYDWLNVIPLLAAGYVGYALVALKETCGHIGYVARCLEEDPAVRKPFGSFLLSPWVRSIFLFPVLLLMLEFGLRCASYDRSLQYERQGDLLYTPIPDQEYVEKISLTPSRVNEYGLRGGPVDLNSGKQVILCLGDSVTYGYGVDDQHSYPAELQKALDREFPGRFLVLNGGVDGYPIPFIREKFLYLWNRGIHPDIVLVGYSFNEGLGLLTDNSDEKTKDLFASRVRMKNRVRSIALYNLIVENWARASYNRMKKYMVPGTNSRTLPQDYLDKRYPASLQTLYDDLNARHVKSAFMLFTGFDARSGKYGTEGPFQLKFGEFAESRHIPLLRTNQALLEGQPPATDIQKYFQDQCHMNESGTQKFSSALAEFLSATNSI